MASLKALHSFEAAVRHRSLTLAARELNVTVAAVASQVRHVEESLGATLLRRRGRSLVASPAALLLALELRAGFDTIDEAVGRFRTATGPGTAVTVSMLPSFASLWLLPRLGEFRSRHPEIDVRISTSEHRVDLVEAGIDCAVRSGSGGWEGLHADALFPQVLAPLCHWSYFQRRPMAAAAAALPDEDLILNAARMGEWRAWFAEAGLDRSDPASGHAVEGRELVAEAVRAAIGIGLLDISIHQRELASGDLVQLPGPVLRTGWSHFLVMPAGAAPSAAALAFVDWLRLAALETQQSGPGRPAAGKA